jgi:hypothetical protein
LKIIFQRSSLTRRKQMGRMKETEALVDAPVIALADDELAGDALVKFYLALGWDRESQVDPCKVRTTKAVFDGLYALMRERCPDPLTAGMALVNKGPGVDDDVPQGKVRLLKGWMIPDEPAGKDEQEDE